MKLTAFRWVPPFAQGVVRDLRVRWALEEAGIPYETHLIGREEQMSDAYRKQQPFGQVPVLQDGDLTLFESGSIVLYLAEKSTVLFPDDAKARARARTWVFAAINSMEPPMQNLATIDLFYPNEEWSKLRRPQAIKDLKRKLSNLSDWMGDKQYLEGQFTVGDLMMTSVLRIARHVDLVAQFPNLEAYQKRCEARPTFKKALADQMKPFFENAPPK